MLKSEKIMPKIFQLKVKIICVFYRTETVCQHNETVTLSGETFQFRDWKQKLSNDQSSDSNSFTSASRSKRSDVVSTPGLQSQVEIVSQLIRNI